MKKERVYITLIIILVIINAIQLASKFASPTPPQQEERKSLKEKIPLILGLDESQTETFIVMATKHRDQIKKLQEQQNELTLRYIDSASDSVLDEIAELHKQKLKLTEHHFRDVFNILDGTQKSKFSGFKQAAFQRINKSRFR